MDRSLLQFRNALGVQTRPPPSMDTDSVFDRTKLWSTVMANSGHVMQIADRQGPLNPPTEKLLQTAFADFLIEALSCFHNSLAALGRKGTYPERELYVSVYETSQPVLDFLVFHVWKGWHYDLLALLAAQLSEYCVALAPRLYRPHHKKLAEAGPKLILAVKHSEAVRSSSPMGMPRYMSYMGLCQSLYDLAAFNELDTIA